MLSCVVVFHANAAENIAELTIGGSQYYDVHWGPVNDGKVVVFHSRGVKIVPLNQLPPEYRAKFGSPLSSTPTPAAPAPEPTVSISPSPEPVVVTPAPRRSSSRGNDWENYNEDRRTQVVLKGKLVERSSLDLLVGYIASRTRLSDGGRSVRGVVFDLAERRTDGNQPSQQFLLRPQLWQRNGERVFLVNYEPEAEAGMLVRLYVQEAKPMGDHKVYEVGVEPTFEAWKRLRPR